MSSVRIHLHDHSVFVLPRQHVERLPTLENMVVDSTVHVPNPVVTRGVFALVVEYLDFYDSNVMYDANRCVRETPASLQTDEAHMRNSFFLSKYFPPGDDERGCFLFQQLMPALDYLEFMWMLDICAQHCAHLIESEKLDFRRMRDRFGIGHDVAAFDTQVDEELVWLPS